MSTSGHLVTASTGRQANERFESYARWPVAILAAAAYVAIWGGWVELGRMCGFGPVNLLPGITNFEVDLSITLPLGMEVYAAYAMGAWLTQKRIDPTARTFAKWSTFASLAIGTSGQIAYHLLAAAGVEQAPWPVVIGVACVSVAVLGMASMLAHRLHVPADRPMLPAEPAQPEPAVTAEDVDALLADLETLQPEEAATEDVATDRPTGRKRRPVTDEERTLIIRLSERESERAISRRVKRSRDTVRRVLEDAAQEAAPDASATVGAATSTDRPADESVWPLTVTA